MTPSWLSTLLSDATGVESSGGEVRLEVRDIGELRLPSGRVIACDPVVEPDLRPFALSFPPGTWPVGITIAHFPGEDQRIAAAWVRASGSLPVRWDAALIEGMGDNPDSAYGVDSGTGGFVSPEAAALLAARLDDAFMDELTAQMDAVYVHTRGWAVVPVPGTDGLNVAAFSSGFGDGAYASYWGYDDAGTLACLLTDFAVVGRAGRDAASSRPWWKVW
jgi:hypothetical protein